MKKLTKEEALEKIEELKNYVSEIEANESRSKTVIYHKDGSVLFESSKATVKEAVEEAVNRGANLWGADLGGANLREANLREANLGGANLREANLREANLWGADLWGADLWGADLGGAELASARFSGRGGKASLTKEQVPVFLEALGFVIEG